MEACNTQFMVAGTMGLSILFASGDQVRLLTVMNVCYACLLPCLSVMLLGVVCCNEGLLTSSHLTPPLPHSTLV